MNKTDENGRITLDMQLQLRGHPAERLIEEAKTRSTEPAVLLADLIETIISDDLFKAIID